MQKKRFALKLAPRLIIALLLAGLQPLAISIFYGYRTIESFVFKEALNNLEAVADSRVLEIQRFINERVSDVGVLAKSPVISGAMQELDEIFIESGVDSEAVLQVQNTFKEYLTSYIEAYGYHDVFLLSRSGDILFSMAHEADFGTNVLNGQLSDSGLAEAFLQASTVLETQMSDFEYYPPCKGPAAFIAAPVFDQNRYVGAAALQIAPDMMNSLIRNYIGLGETGETVPAKQYGDEVLFMTPLRNDPESGFGKRLSLSEDRGSPIQQAVKGKKGAGIARDYRNVEVLAAWRYLPDLQWGVVTKIDKEEIYRPIEEIRETFMYLGIAVLGFISLMAFVSSRSIFGPIKNLTEIAAGAATGDFTRRALVVSSDEIGTLTRSVNLMMEMLSDVAAQAEAVSKGDLTAAVSPRSERDTIGIALQSMTRTLQEISSAAATIAGGRFDVSLPVKSEKDSLAEAINAMALALKSNQDASDLDNWFKTGQSKLAEVIQGESELAKLSQSIVRFLAKYLGADVGTFYTIDDAILRLTGTYAFSRRKILETEIRLGQGLAGEAALEQEHIFLEDVPEDYVRVESTLGSAPVKCVLAYPFVLRGAVTSLVELASLREMPKRTVDFLDKVSESIAVAVYSVRQQEKTKALLEESIRQSEALKFQKEELRVANEALVEQKGVLNRVNSELEEQACALKLSEERLRVQHEELQTAVEELEERNELLERQRKEVESSRTELAQKAEDLAQAGKYKSEFLANMSHELRTPLNSLLLLARELMDNKETNLTDDQLECAKVIFESGNDLLSLINEILDLSKIEAGRIELRLETVVLSNVRDTLKTSFAHMAEQKKIAFDVRIDKDAPDQIETDAKRFHQVLKNLISNAIKFTDQGSVQVRFHSPDPGARLKECSIDLNQALAVSVIDTGIGIPKEQQTHIFEAFKQADGGLSRRYEGTGLGLSIARDLVKLLGGEIQLESVPQKGSTFTVFLPLAGRFASRAPASAAAPQDRSPARRKSPAPLIDSLSPSVGFENVVSDDMDNIAPGDRVILVIEDDVKFARILVRHCRDRGFKCITAQTGERGLELAKEVIPHGVILDISLPGIDGWQVLQSIKDDTRIRHIPVNIISAEAPSPIGLSKGAVGHLQKPVSPEHLAEVFNKLENTAHKQAKRLLVVAANDDTRKAISELVKGEDVLISEAATAQAAVFAVEENHYDCMILDPDLADMDGIKLIDILKNRNDLAVPPIIVYTGRDFSSDSIFALREYAESIVIKDVRSEERLLDEVSLFLHQVVGDMPEKKRQIITDLHQSEAVFKDKKVMIVDDDMRASFALSKLLTERGMQVFKAENGEKALSTLAEVPDMDLVLMDIMMPILDGLETIRAVRADRRFARLPIIALTAKAMKGDKEKCLVAGADDYLTKPIDRDRLLSMMRVWLYD